MNSKNKKISKIFLIIYLFIVLGIILIKIIIDASAFNNKTSYKITNESQKIEKYWEDTEINISHLQEYVNDVKCQESAKNFLSCINSLLFALERTDFHLTVAGEIKENTESNLDSSNEKQKLKDFLNLYDKKLSNNFKFDQLWEKTLGLSKSGFKKHLIAYGINGFLSISKDPHTYIGPTDYFTEVAFKNEKSKYLVGLTLNKKNRKLLITQIIKKSDADLTGLKVDDQILSINGKLTNQMTVYDSNSLFRDSNQESFQLEIIRKNKTISKEVKRTYRILSQVYGEILNSENKIGYIQLSKFSFNVCEKVKLELEKLNPYSLKGLILDLRDNSGGVLSEVACLAGLFIGENKKIFSVRYMNDLMEESQTTSDLLYTGPMVILTNNYSASASELLTGAMQEYQRAVIIGEKTFGKGSFQEVQKWNGSSKITLYKTEGFYLLPSGESTQLKGVIPDFVMNNKDGNREQDIYQYPLEYKERNIQKTRKVFLNNNWDNCLKKIIKNKLAEDPILDKAQDFLNCQIGKNNYYH